MKRSVFLLILVAFLETDAQIPGRRGYFSLLGVGGYTSSWGQPKVTVLRGAFALQPEKIENPECYDEQGRLVDCNNRNIQLGGGLMYRLHDRPGAGSGWMLQGWYSYQQQSYTLAYPSNRSFSIPVNCTPSIRRVLRSNALNVAVGRFWPVSNDPDGTRLVVRLGAMYAHGFKTLRGTLPVRLPDPRPLSYIDASGSGTLIESTPPNTAANWLVTPEVGIMGGNFPAELVASVALPVNPRVVFSEKHTFARNRYIVGENRVEYSNAAFYLTLRMWLDFKRKPRAARPPSETRAPEPPVYRPLPPAPTTPPPVAPATPYARHPLDRPQTLKVFFDLRKAELKPESFAELDEVTRWMRGNPAVLIRLEGHTDVVGDAKENETLSLQRVVAVKDYLSLHGVMSDRVGVVGRGSSRPLRTDCLPPKYCPENRRVEMVILSR